MIESRREYKYFVPKPLIPAIRREIAAFCDLDSHSNVEKYYQVDSLYFDNPGLRCYFDRLDGNYHKLKFRLRTYEHAGQTRTFAELKRKEGEHCLKSKTEIPSDQVRELVAGRTSSAALKPFADILRLNNFSPFLRLTYKRQAFFYRAYHDLRLTFDYDIRCRRFTGWHGDALLPVLPGDSEILEVKCRGVLPWWLQALLRKYRLQKQSISKYLLAVQAIALNSSLCLK